MLTASTATGQLAFLPLIAALTERYGWRTRADLRLLLSLAAALVALLLVRDRPADLGLPLYGEMRSDAGAGSGAGLVTLLMSPLSCRCARRRAPRAFWVLFATFFVCGLSTNGLIQTHFISLCGDFGMARGRRRPACWR